MASRFDGTAEPWCMRIVIFALDRIRLSEDSIYAANQGDLRNAAAIGVDRNTGHPCGTAPFCLQHSGITCMYVYGIHADIRNCRVTL